MTQQLLNKDYLTFKSQIHILKQFYSKEKESYKQKQIIQLNNIHNTIKNMVSDNTQDDGQYDFGHQNDIKIVEVNQQSESHYSLNIKEVEKLVNEWVALDNLNKYQEAIECYEKAISINPKQHKAWSNKGFLLHKLKQYKDAIVCYDQALSISIISLRLQRKADSLYELGDKQEAKQFYLDALQKGSNQNQKDYIIKVMKQHH